MASAGVCSESVQEDPTGRTVASEVERERPTYWKPCYRQLNYRAGLQKKTESFSRCAASGRQNNPVFSAIFHFNSFLMSEWWASSTAGLQPPIRVWFLRHEPLSRSPHVIVRSGCKKMAVVFQACVARLAPSTAKANFNGRQHQRRCDPCGTARRKSKTK